jgi:radical SAM protein with 4Fe4S-binding SPASM domain
LRRIIDEFARLGGTRINLTGGEFLTHPDWLSILDFGLQHPSIASVCLQTNATLITAEHLYQLRNLPGVKLTLQVSLDGARASVHDAIRGKGSFAKAMNGLGMLVQGGFGPRTRIAFTEMAHNFHDLPRLLALVDEMGLDRLICNTLVKGGRAAASLRARLPTPDQYRGLIRRYQSDPLFKKRCDQKATIAAIEWFKHHSEAVADICTCIRNLFVDSRGRVYPCPMLLVEDLASASAHDRPMDQVIDQALAKWRDMPSLVRRRQQAINACVACPGRPHCGGGCMGRALVVSGDGMAPEDRCALRRAVYD